MAGVMVTAVAAAGAAEAAGPALGRATPPGMYVGIGNHQLHIHCTGEGSPAVVFESGLGGTSLEWTKVQPEVASFTRACSYDRAGYGWSQSGPLPRHAERVAAELDTLLTYASVRPPYVLVGHSFGGLAARVFAHQHPQDMAGLVLVDATHEAQFQGPPRRKPLAPTGRVFVIANLWEVPEGLPTELKPLARRLALVPRAVRTLYGELGSMRASAAQVRAIDADPRVPVRVLSRAIARSATSRQAVRTERRWRALQRDLATRIASGALQVAPGSGHHIHLDRPDLVVSAIRSVVDVHREQDRATQPQLASARAIPPRR